MSCHVKTDAPILPLGDEASRFESVDEATLEEVPCAACHGAGWGMRDLFNGGDIEAAECEACRGSGKSYQSPTPSST